MGIKFKIGDKVYILGYYYNGKDSNWYVNGPCKIFEIIIKKSGIYYRVNMITEDIYEDVYNILKVEKDCFSTKAEALTECDRRNNETKN